MYEELKASGITANTPKQILLGAGTIHKNFMLGYYKPCASTETGALEVVADTATPTTGEVKLSVAQARCTSTLTVGDHVLYVSDKWNFDESIIGATQGGNHLTIQRETINVEADGAKVKVKGLEFKVGETATLEVNLLEINKENVKLLTGASEANPSGFTGYDDLISKSQIEKGDYLDNFAFVGKRTDGTPIIIIFETALCTSGIDINTQNKENSTFPATFECYADINGDHDKLPWHILIPSAS